MAILTHGSDLSLAPTLTPIVRQAGGTARAAMDRLAPAGFEAVQLDATLRGLRPRELDRGGRRELANAIRRRNLRLAGLDLFIPRKHYLDPQHVDRAMSATTGAIELAADLDRVPVSLTLPIKRLPADLAEALVEAADGHSVRLAVHCEHEPTALHEWIESVDLPALGAAIDPATLLAQNADPSQWVQRFGHHLTVARLSDLERGVGDETEDTEQPHAIDSVRCAVGQGELDVMAYRVSLDLATGRAGPVVLDLRGLTSPMQAAQSAKRAWDDAAVSF